MKQLNDWLNMQRVRAGLIIFLLLLKQVAYGDTIHLDDAIALAMEYARTDPIEFIGRCRPNRGFAKRVPPVFRVLIYRLIMIETGYCPRSCLTAIA